MSVRILQGNVFDTLPTLAPGSVDVCVTSPPYWMLRSYLPKGHALKALELGSEKTPEEYVENIVRVFSLVKPALAEHGTCWLNVGDTYTHARGKRKPGDKHGPKQCTNAGSVAMPSAVMEGMAEGNLALIPQRLALALQSDGWIVRSVIVWHKPAPMPASVSGWRWQRCRVKMKGQNNVGSGKQAENRLTAGFNERWSEQTEANRGDGHSGQISNRAQPEWQGCPGCPKCKPHGGYVLRKGSWRPTSSWEPILLLAKSPGYFCDGESVKQPPSEATISRDQYTRILDDPDEQFAVAHDHETICTGANPRDVQTWAAEPLSNITEQVPVYVGADEASDGMERITSPDCPVHGDRRASTFPCDEHSAETKTRTQHNDGRPAQEQQGEPCSTQDQSSQEPGLFQDSAPAAKSRSKRKSKKLPVPPTSQEDNACEETSSRTNRTSSQGVSEPPHHDKSENKTAEDSASDVIRSGLSGQTISDNAGKSKSSCTCSFRKYIVREYSHYASFPTALVDFCLRAGTSQRGYCPECGKPWCRVLETKFYGSYHDHDADGEQFGQRQNGGGLASEYESAKTLGWRPTCSHGEQEPRAATVLDPFCGSGRTAIQAQRLSLDFVGCELNPQYVEMAQRLLKENMPLFA